MADGRLHFGTVSGMIIDKGVASCGMVAPCGRLVDAAFGRAA